jgi:GntR family transcriptional regulator
MAVRKRARIRRGNGVPLYRQVYELLLERIASGESKPGSKLPTEIDLAKSLKVSSITCRRALQELAAEGYITRTQRRGSIVQPMPATAVMSASLDRLLGATKMGRWRANFDVLEFEYVVPPKDVMQIFGANKGDMFQRSASVISRRGHKFAHVTTWTPELIGREFSASDVKKHNHLDLLKRAGIEVSQIVQTIGGHPMPAAIAKLIDAKSRSAATRMTRTVFDKSGSAVEYIVAYSAWDRYEYRIVMQ